MAERAELLPSTHLADPLLRHRPQIDAAVLGCGGAEAHANKVAQPVRRRGWRGRARGWHGECDRERVDDLIRVTARVGARVRARVRARARARARVRADASYD